MWVQSGTFICSIIVLNLNISFKFCARLGFNVVWFVKCMKIRKLKIEIIQGISQKIKTVATMVGNKKKKLGTTHRMLENILYTTHINHI